MHIHRIFGCIRIRKYLQIGIMKNMRKREGEMERERVRAWGEGDERERKRAKERERECVWARARARGCRPLRMGIMRTTRERKTESMCVWHRGSGGGGGGPWMAGCRPLRMGIMRTTRGRPSLCAFLRSYTYIIYIHKHTHKYICIFVYI